MECSCRRRSIVCALAVLACAFGWPGDAAAQQSLRGGDAQRGATLIQHYGCGSCHTIPGIDGADADVGPPLTAVGRRIFIAGILRNTPENMIAWLQKPQAIIPGNAMPDMGIDDQAARDVAAYLYTLR